VCPRDAITEFEVVVGLAPTHADACENLGSALMQRRSEAEAGPAFEQALHLRPGPDVNDDLGVALIARDRKEDSAGHFRAALRQDPALPEAHYQVALLADDADRLTEAEGESAETLR